MNKVVQEFLALRRAHHGLGQPDTEMQLPTDRSPEIAPRSPLVNEPRRGITAPPDAHRGSEVEAVEGGLVAYFADLLAAHPAARPVTRRGALAEYLAKGILGKYGDPTDVSWCSGRPVSHRNRAHIPWTARCPAGHFTDEALWTNQAVGWVCEQCQKVYDRSECSILPRPG